MHVNVLNLSEILAASLLCVRQEKKLQPPAESWVVKTLRRGLQGDGFRATANILEIKWQPCVTLREFRLMAILTNSQKGLDVYILSPDDFARKEWLTKSLAEGNSLIYYHVKEDTFNRVLHLAEAVQAMLPGRTNYDNITLERSRELAIEWQKQLDHQAKLTEGKIELLFTSKEGLELWWLQDKQAYIREGYMMHHCVGSYPVRADLRILSVRQAGRNLATAAVNVATDASGKLVMKIQQIKGVTNIKPSEEAHKLVQTWIRSKYILAEEDALSQVMDPFTGQMIHIPDPWQLGARAGIARFGVAGQVLAMGHGELRGEGALPQQFVDAPITFQDIHASLRADVVSLQSPAAWPDSMIDALIARLRQRGIQL